MAIRNGAILCQRLEASNLQPPLLRPPSLHSQVQLEEGYPPWMVLLIERQVTAAVGGAAGRRLGGARPAAQMRDLGGRRGKDRAAAPADRVAEVDGFGGEKE